MSFIQEKILQENFLLDPGKLFFTIWIFAIFLFQFNFGTEIVESSLVSLIFLIICVFVISFSSTSFKTAEILISSDLFEENIRNIRIVSIIFFSLLIYEVVAEIQYFGTLPFLASFTFKDLGYNDIAPIFKYKHNFFVKANSIFLSGYFFLLFHLFKKKIYIISYIIVIMTAVVYLNRSTMISIGVVSLIIYLYFNKIKRKQLLLLLSIGLISFFVFDKIYFLRNKFNVNFYLSSYENFGFWKSVERGAEGIYTYIASPVSNLLYNIDIDVFDLFNFRFGYFVRGFLPSGLADYLFGPVDFNDTIYFPRTSNVFSAFPPFFFTFGLIGSLLAFILLGLLMRKLYRNYIKNPGKFFLTLVFLNHMIVLSVFSTSFNNMVYYFPIVISFFLPSIQLTKIE